ncbi:tRNA threonylcarbamoyladenosine biosynthesis protein RimN [Acinetobacter qingfengensis]|uniref:Threonylcarbamoyl-AMP synthase n=1 Tax=Acinetobacter qingfengensis TaxID=1262585 RepID=A0A1E7RCN1_9GAMM|nr:Sua5/YciO/YrdC/YwlC family protein [Acinetobacter qingfengensis]KAA8732089.1 tRNA threonylcarbamoyladenosine biosynthesis protein RimN [Acinetobacter qingfengensis]OEY97169.1 tRNA threonylcarbamoyladenosine biosynthesis protein RimN [Acinetobacter qingfengensis]
MNSVDLDQAIACLKQGNVLAYPTEAVWGLGCDPAQQQAFEKILKLKQRPIEKGVILLSESIARIEPLLSILDPDIRQQVVASWQNSNDQQRATTWLLPIQPAIPTWIYGKHDRVAIRVTQHPLCQQLCAAFDGMVVSTSANPAGSTPAKTAQQVANYFSGQISILSGNLGHSPEPSRILDAVTGQLIRA